MHENFSTELDFFTLSYTEAKSLGNLFFFHEKISIYVRIVEDIYATCI